MPDFHYHPALVARDEEVEFKRPTETAFESATDTFAESDTAFESEIEILPMTVRAC